MESFSILGRIVGTATIWTEHSPTSRNWSLSVSSVGSWALQLLDYIANSLSALSFSILGRIVGTATASTGVFQSLARTFSILGRIVGTATKIDGGTAEFNNVTFSILGRIVGTATLGGRRVVAMNSRFQYPRSDRGHCNLFLCRKPTERTALSVSSVGSWALQPYLHHSVQRTSWSFSILGRIVGTATTGGMVGTGVVKTFQYPRSDRGHCNFSPRSLRPPPPRRLSVSSVGSWALQLAYRLSRIAYRISRIAYRSSPTAHSPAPQNHPAWGRRPHRRPTSNTNP